MVLITQPEDYQHRRLPLNILSKLLSLEQARVQHMWLTNIKFESAAKAALRISCGTIPTQWVIRISMWTCTMPCGAISSKKKKHGLGDIYVVVPCVIEDFAKLKEYDLWAWDCGYGPECVLGTQAGGVGERFVPAAWAGRVVACLWTCEERRLRFLSCLMSWLFHSHV